MCRQENAHMPVFLKNFDNTRSQWPPLLHVNGPPTWQEQSWPPLSMAPLSGKKNLGPGHWYEGGMVGPYCTEACMSLTWFKPQSCVEISRRQLCQALVSVHLELSHQSWSTALETAPSCWRLVRTWGKGNRQPGCCPIPFKRYQIILGTKLIIPPPLAPLCGLV